MAEKIKKQKEMQYLTSELEAVRKLPDVYIGALGDRGFINMFREILQNSLDEIIKGNTLDKNIIVSFDARNYVSIIEDNGQGINLKDLEKVFSVLHSSTNYDKKEGSGDYSSGKNGMGSTITNFLSRFFYVESYRMDGTAARVEFTEGVISKHLTPIKTNKNSKPHGLITTFAPSAMVGELTVTDADIQHLIWLITHLCKIGTTVTFNAIDKMGKKHKNIIKNENGLYDILGMICNNRITEPIHFMHDNGTMKIEVLFTYDVSAMDDPQVFGFANTCPSNKGTHIDGFMDGMIKYFRDYMNKIYLANNKKLTVNAADIKTGLRAVVSCFHIKPLFTGQSKEDFSKEDMKPFAMDQTLKALDEWAKANPNDLQKICKYLKDVCEIRSKVDDKKIKMSDKYTASVLPGGLPSKYKKPNGKKDIEVWIVEGDSAASSLENNRDKNTQGIFPIKGKLSNALTTPTAKYFNNDEVAGLFKIFGYDGYKKKFDPDKFKPSKVVIATDADADGDHITFLVFTMFLRYLPFVIEQGKLYIANPPLFGAQIGKQKKFFANNIDYIEFVQNTFCKENTICNLKNKPYTKKEIVQILYKNRYYKDELDKVSWTYSLDQYLLEFILFNRKLDNNKLISAIKKLYKYVEAKNVNNVLVLKVLAGGQIQTIFFTQRLFNDCEEVIKYIDKSEEYYLINGQKTSIYGLMSLFKKFEPKNLSRYKGLGRHFAPSLYIYSVENLFNCWEMLKLSSLY